jgi:4-amino-4-deoxy-L-arabinose transferase-like glycosyltransferase
MNPKEKQIEASVSGTSSEYQARVAWWLAAILVLALALRLWGIDFGLPYELTSDESKEIHRALKLGVGEYYWGFGKGGLYYILFLEYAFLFGWWWITGQVANGTDFAVQFIRDPTMFFLLGRLTVAIMSVLTCLVVFHIGRRIYDWRVGLGAAFIAATTYVHAAHSHIINVDIGMLLAMWGSLLSYLEYEKSANRRWLVAAGILAGVAIAFKMTGAVSLLALFLAIVSRAENRFKPRTIFKEVAITTCTAIVTLTIVAPEWIFSVGNTLQPWLAATKTMQEGVFKGDRREAFRLITIERGETWTGYLKILVSDRNLVLTVAAVLGAGTGLLRRHRWSIISTVLIVLFVAVMSAASRRGKPEHYLLPILPCLWLLASHAIITITERYRSLTAAGFVSVVALSLFVLVRQNVEWTKPDTRIVAKQWIEANIPGGSKILMDSYQYRFIPSPPLTPDKTSIHRQIAGVASEPGRFRGVVSQRTLKLYADAMARVDGPVYDLHPTVWGLAVEDPGYYGQRCFDYIITSSMISRRYVREIDRARFPKSARFYEGLDGDPRLKKIFTVEPLPWERTGPTIAVYKLLTACSEPQSRDRDSQPFLDEESKGLMG